MAAHLNDAQFGADEIARTVTIRQLLTHTSGVFGDYFGHFGRGDGAVARYVSACSQLPQLFAPGATMSYCNSGFVALRKSRRAPHRQALQRCAPRAIAGPIGADESATVPEEAILGRVAVGHLPQPPDLKRRLVTPVWSLPDSVAPAGALLCTTASDLVRFGRLHLDRGRAETGAEILSAYAVEAMRERLVELPSRATLGVSAWGLGWMLFDLGGVVAFGHNGASIGQASFPRVVPESHFVCALLVNGPGGDALFEDLFSQLARDCLASRSHPLSLRLIPVDRSTSTRSPEPTRNRIPELRSTPKAGGWSLTSNRRPRLRVSPPAHPSGEWSWSPLPSIPTRSNRGARSAARRPRSRSTNLIPVALPVTCTRVSVPSRA